MVRRSSQGLWSLNGKRPMVADGVFVAPGAAVIGDVTLGAGASVWFNAVLRGDMHWIRVGARTNVQDNAVVHVTSGHGPTTLGSDVTVGHSAVVHACTVEDLVLIGMGSVILDGAHISRESLVAAGTVVPPGKKFPPRSMIMGNPGRVVRSLSDLEVAGLRQSVQTYMDYASRYQESLFEIEEE